MCGEDVIGFACDSLSLNTTNEQTNKLAHSRERGEGAVVACCCHACVASLPLIKAKTMHIGLIADSLLSLAVSGCPATG